MNRSEAEWHRGKILFARRAAFGRVGFLLQSAFRACMSPSSGAGQAHPRRKQTTPREKQHIILISGHRHQFFQTLFRQDHIIHFPEPHLFSRKNISQPRPTAKHVATDFGQKLGLGSASDMHRHAAGPRGARVAARPLAPAMGRGGMPAQRPPTKMHIGPEQDVQPPRATFTSGQTKLFLSQTKGYSWPNQTIFGSGQSIFQPKRNCTRMQEVQIRRHGSQFEAPPAKHANP